MSPPETPTRTERVRLFLRHALTDLFSMTPWPLEIAGAFLFWHYGNLFSHSDFLPPAFRQMVAELVPGNSWGTCAQVLGCVLGTVGFAAWLGHLRLFGLRIVLAVLGLLTWSALVYSCWRGDVPGSIYRAYAFYLGAQVYVAMLLHVRRREHRDGLREGAASHGLS